MLLNAEIKNYLRISPFLARVIAQSLMLNKGVVFGGMTHPYLREKKSHIHISQLLVRRRLCPTDLTSDNVSEVD